MPSKLPRRSTGSQTATRTNRGQTLQDFILGIGLFIVTVTFVLGLFPSFLSPFTTGVGGEERAQANRVARVMVLELSTSEGETALDAEALDTALDSTQTELRNEYGLPETAGINVTIRELDGDRIVEYGGAPLATPKNRKNQTAVSVARVVTINQSTVDQSKLPAGEDDICKPGCRLVVKVW